jgi:hypothetical protein
MDGQAGSPDSLDPKVGVLDAEISSPAQGCISQLASGQG